MQGVSWYKLVAYILLSAKRRAYCPHRNNYNLNSWQIENVIACLNFAKLIPLGIPRCNSNQRVFHKNCYIFRESIRLGIKKCNCNCNLKEIHSRKQKIVACNDLDDEGIYVHTLHSQQSRPIWALKTLFCRHFGASNTASTKARLLKHDFPVRYTAPPTPPKWPEIEGGVYMQETGTIMICPFGVSSPIL